MKKAEARWEVRMTNYYRPGAWEWKTMKTFSNPQDADEWLMTYIKENKQDCRDYTIRMVTR